MDYGAVIVVATYSVIAEFGGLDLLLSLVSSLASVASLLLYFPSRKNDTFRMVSIVPIPHF